MTKRKKKRNGSNGGNGTLSITLAEQKMMFEFYLANGQNLAKTARHFGRARTTLVRVRKAYKWNDIVDKIQTKRADELAKHVVKNEIDDMRLVEGLQRKIFSELLDKDNNIGSTPSDAVNVTKLKHELLRMGGSETKGDTNVVNNVVTIIATLANANEAERRRLIGNRLAKYGVFDDGTINRLAAVFDSLGDPPNRN